MTSLKVYKLVLTAKSDILISGGVKGNVISFNSEKLPNGKEIYYIPGSSLKGVIRCELERMGEDSTFMGIQNMEGVKYTETAVKFHDLIMQKGHFSYRTHVAIDIETGCKREKGLFADYTIARGSQFIGYVVLLEDCESLLKAGIKSAEHFGIGSGRSRGLGEVEIRMEETSIEEMLKFYEEVVK